LKKAARAYVLEKIELIGTYEKPFGVFAPRREAAPAIAGRVHRSAAGPQEARMFNRLIAGFTR
jgi:hypothetical protein